MILLLGVHLGKIGQSVVESISSGRVHGLLGLHGGLHDGVVSHEGIGVVLFGVEDGLFDTLAQAVVGDSGDNLLAVLLLGVDPSDNLVHVLETDTFSTLQIGRLDHGLANGGGVLLKVSDHGGIVKDAAGDHAVSSSQSQDQVKGRFLLDVVIAESAAIFQLLSGKNQSLLVWGDSLLVLDLGLDVIDGVGWFDIESDGLTGKSLDKNLSKRIQTSREKGWSNSRSICELSAKEEAKKSSVSNKIGYHTHCTRPLAMMILSLIKTNQSTGRFFKKESSHDEYWHIVVSRDVFFSEDLFGSSPTQSFVLFSTTKCEAQRY